MTFWGVFVLTKFFISLIGGLAVILGLNTQADAGPKSTNHNKSQEISKIHRSAPDLKPKILKMGVKAYHKAQAKGLVHDPYLTIIDYSLDSTQKRLWVINMNNDRLAYHTVVAHGKGSGRLKSTHFSNQARSHASSLGVFVTKGTYFGGKGYSLRMQGLERGVNDHAFNRDIVIHGAWYANPSFAKQNGYLGRSWGCPAVPVKMAKPIINTIKNGSVIFSYYPVSSWLNHSSYLA